MSGRTMNSAGRHRSLRVHGVGRPSWQQVLAAALLAVALLAGMLASRPAAADQRDHGDRRDFARGDRRDNARGDFNRRYFDRRDFRREDFDHDRRFFYDERFHHDYYYPRRGVFFGGLPPGYRTFYWSGRPYFFAGGVWYMGAPGGFVVATPPFGLTVSVLPPFYSTVYLGGVPYYYANDVYYQWNPGVNAYQVVAPPAGADVQPPPGEAAPPPPNTAPPQPPPTQQEQLFIYPRNGQSAEQQSQDRYECHTWATSQTGFDPTQPAGGVPPDQNASRSQQYHRAMVACLTGRGYSVN